MARFEKKLHTEEFGTERITFFNDEGKELLSFSLEGLRTMRTGLTETKGSEEGDKLVAEMVVGLLSSSLGFKLTEEEAQFAVEDI